MCQHRTHERDASCLLHSCLIDEFQWDESSGSLREFSVYAYVETKVIWETVVLVELAVAMAMEHDGAMRLMIPCDHRIMAKGQLQILRQERAGGRLDGQIENLCRSLEIVEICPYWTVVIALYEKQGFLNERTVWLVFQYVSVTKVKVCGKKYLVHDHRRFRTNFRRFSS